MEFIYLLIVGVALYAFSDWVLRRYEAFLGRPLEQRNLVFFAILLISALVTFGLLRLLLSPQISPG